MRGLYTYMIVLTILAIFWPGSYSSGCTVFYIYKNGKVLGAGNEDWKDPNSKMWFYPSCGERKGWVKFGYSGGFPQAGMNDSGIFWDGTSNPYQPLPYAEAHKELYDGPLLQKVMEECRNIIEVKDVFTHYYCQDQYRGQYLIGGPEGYSVIIDGDSILENEFGHQVLTNFHQTNPGLGGYPCWRFEKADDLLTECDLLTEYFIGSVLSATRQEGAYPTQYSLIFDPIDAKIWVFHFHNFDEFLLIDLEIELKKDTLSYSIPSLFSRIKLVSPVHDSEIQADSVVVTWQGLPGSTYEILISEEKDFNHFNAIPSASLKETYSPTSLYLLILIIPGLISIRKPKFGLVLLLLVSVIMLTSCSKKRDEASPSDPTILISKVITGLETGKTYYWKISAISNEGSPFSTESVVRSFKTNY